MQSADPGTGSGLTEVRFGSVVPVVRETGNISLSVDGVGTNSASGIVQVEKPAGATVRKAFMAAASTGFSFRALANGDVRIDGVPFNWSISTPSSIGSSNSWAEVTSLVKPKIDAAPAGRVNFTITEVSSGGIDGEILAVIFDDPNQTTSNTVALLFGAQAVGGDTFAVGLADPINLGDPNLQLTMSLGISFGFQPGGQLSTVDVNGMRLSSSAGGQDDFQGFANNGALLTVGGLDDSTSNPPPFASPSIGFRTDDELYDLKPFVHNGDTNINIFTRNPSNDDNIFFSALFLKATTAVVGEGIVLSPTFASNPVGSQHTVTATVQNNNGAPIVNRQVTFEIVAGPHTGLMHTATTNSIGRADFTYTGTAAGTDEIEAKMINSQGQTSISNMVVAEWIATNDPPTISCPAELTLECESPSGSEATLSVEVADPDGDDLTLTWQVDGMTVQVDLISGGSPASITRSFTHLYSPGPHTIDVTISDNEAGPVTCSTTVNVIDTTPPQVECPAPTEVITCQAPVPDVVAGVQASDNCTLANSLTITQNPPAGTMVNSGQSVTITVTVTDGASLSSTCTTSFTVVNNAPSANAGGPYNVAEGSTVNVISAIGSDPDDGAVSFAWDLDDNGSFETPGQSVNFSAASLNGPTSLPISVQVTDRCGVSTTASTTINVLNVAPSLAALGVGAASIPENGSTTLTGSFADPGPGENHVVTINWGDGSANTTIPLSAGVYGFTAPHQFLDDNPTATTSDNYTITVTVADDAGSGGGTTGITVNNVAPAITTVTGPAGPLAQGSTASITVDFTDVGSQDTHTVTYSWDDGLPNTTQTAAGTGNGSNTATHTYAAAGVYKVGVTVTDDDTGSVSSVFEFVVVYDPSAGFVTGGGFIVSPSGAYLDDPTLTGRANFGFVSKYQRGSSVPTGETEFQFHAGNFNFHSTAYDWLVISGPKAQYKGSGQINGSGDYGFLLTATDGQVNGGGEVDKFRIKIWDKVTGVVVYDNVRGNPDDIDAANPQAIVGGSIVIHRR
jgi:hypothetical protein